MANKILPFYETFGTLTISLASLASSTAGVGRQSTIVDNSTTRVKRVRIFGKAKLGTSPAAGAVYVYAIRGEKTGTAFRTDAAGATDAGLTVINAQIIGVFATKSSPATGDNVTIDCILEDPGPEWGICIVQNTTVNLDATGGNHVIEYRGEEPEVQ
jgi:hypothetical protein